VGGVDFSGVLTAAQSGVQDVAQKAHRLAAETPDGSPQQVPTVGGRR
jgi:hypothetical protein